MPVTVALNTSTGQSGLDPIAGRERGNVLHDLAGGVRDDCVAAIQRRQWTHRMQRPSGQLEATLRGGDAAANPGVQ